MAMLSDWADVIILTSDRYLSYVPYRHKDKLKLWHVGRDRWFKGYPEDLMQKFQEFIDKDGI